LRQCRSTVTSRYRQHDDLSHNSRIQR
jgi:hypothetical protein